MTDWYNKSRRTCVELAEYAATRSKKLALRLSLVAMAYTGLAGGGGSGGGGSSGLVIEASGDQMVNEPQLPSQGQPNLVIASPSVSNSSPVAETTFTLSATVRNVGGREPRQPQRCVTTGRRMRRSQPPTQRWAWIRYQSLPLWGATASRWN